MKCFVFLVILVIIDMSVIGVKSQSVDKTEYKCSENVKFSFKSVHVHAKQTYEHDHGALSAVFELENLSREQSDDYWHGFSTELKNHIEKLVPCSEQDVNIFKSFNNVLTNLIEFLRYEQQMPNSQGCFRLLKKMLPILTVADLEDPSKLVKPIKEFNGDASDDEDSLLICWQESTAGMAHFNESVIYPKDGQSKISLLIDSSTDRSFTTSLLITIAICVVCCLTIISVIYFIRECTRKKGSYSVEKLRRKL